MGNVLSEDAAAATNDETRFGKEGLSVNLESPHADKEMNYGASVPRCQPKHTERDTAQTTQQQQQQQQQHLLLDQQEQDQQQDTAPKSGNSTSATNHDAAAADDERGKQKLSYLQMARMGYQELVNAIIRPPRADYKVSQLTMKTLLHIFRSLTNDSSSLLDSLTD